MEYSKMLKQSAKSSRKVTAAGNTTLRNSRSTPRKPVTSSTPAATVAYSTLRSSSPLPSVATARSRPVRKETSTTPNANSVRAAPKLSVPVQWFQPARIVTQFNADSEEDDENNSESPPIPEIIEAELTTILVDEPPTLYHSQDLIRFEDVVPSGQRLNHESAHNLGQLVDLDFDTEPLPLLTTASETRLDDYDFSMNESLLSSTFRSPSTSDLRPSPSRKASVKSSSSGGRCKSNHRACPGRYKVKVLEQISSKKKMKQKSMDMNSPYHAEDFIDVDGKLKLRGKAFETYVTHQQYELLRDFYVPGVIASRLSRRRSKHSDSSIATRSTISSQRSHSVGHPKHVVEPQEVTLTKVNVAKSDTSVNRTDNKLESKVTLTDRVEIDVQTVAQERLDQECQTPKFRYRPTVNFDLERTTVEDFERDSDTTLDNSNQSLTSAMGMMATCGDDDTSVNADVNTKEVLWDRKVTTAVQMVASILSAQQVGTISLDSPFILGAVELLGKDQLQECMDSLKIPNDEEPDVQPDTQNNMGSLLNLLETYSAAYSYILEHIKAANAYDTQFPVAADSCPVLVEDECDEWAVSSPEESTVEFHQMLSISNSSIAESIGDSIDVKDEMDEMLGQREINPMMTCMKRHPNFLRYVPEITSGQLKFQLGATPDHLFQEIHLLDSTLRMTYSVNGVSHVLSATRGKDGTLPISTGNLLLMHNQHGSLICSRLITSKYFLNRVLLQLMSLGELFLVGKYSQLGDSQFTTISPKKYHTLRQISVFASILYPLCHSFVHATRKIHTALRDLVSFRALTRCTSLIVIGPQPKSTTSGPNEVTVPIAGVLPAPAAYSSLLAALGDIDSIIDSGSKSLQALNITGGVNIPAKYYKTLVSCLDGVKQLERGRDLDFGALLIGYTVDLTLLEQPGQNRNSLNPKQKCHLYRNCQEVQNLLHDLTKLSRKVTLICSYASSRSMLHLHKFRHAQRRNFGCFGIMLRRFQRPPRNSKREEVNETEALPDLQLEKNALEQDRTRLVQMLRAISNESTVSFSIF